MKLLFSVKSPMRFGAVLTLAAFFNQFLFVSFANAMSNVVDFSSPEDKGYYFSNTIQTDTGLIDFLRSQPEINAGDTYSPLYVKADHVDATVLTGYRTLSEFKSSLAGTPAAGDKQYIPITVGDITTFIVRQPLLELRMVGDDYVNTRLVRDQIQQKLGRNLITSPEYPRFQSEKDQFNTLLNNAKSVAANIQSLRYGQVYNPFLNGSSIDMIWPEVRNVNGVDVIVPIVYLSNATINTYSVKGHTIEFHQGALTKTALINGVDISLGRSAFLKTMNDLTVENGSVNSSGSMQLISGGTLSLLSSAVNADGDVLIAGKSVQAETILHRYDLGNETGSRYGQITEITAGGDILLKSYSNLNLYGVSVDAGGGITIEANGSVKIAGVPVQSTYSGREGRWSVERSEVEYLLSRLNAEDTIRILASGQIQIEGAEIVSDRGQIELLAGLGVTIIDNLQQSQMQRKGKFGKKKVNESVYQTVAIRSILDAGKGVKLSTEFGDINLRAVDISSTAGTQISAKHGAVNLLMTVETDHYSYSSVKQGMFTTETKNKGHQKEKGILNSIQGGVAIEALNGVTIEYTGQEGLDLEQQFAELRRLANEPGGNMSWLNDVLDDDQLNLELAPHELEFRSWYKSNKSLSPAAMAVIVIAVAIAAGPTATALSGQVAGATAALGAGVSAGLGAAAGAAFTTMVTTATTSLASGKSVSETLSLFDDDEYLNSLATTMVTAGLLAGIDAQFFNGSTDGFNAAAASGGSQQGVDAANAANEAANAASSISAQITQATIHSSVKAGITSLTEGWQWDQFATAFGRDLGQYAIAEMGEYTANKIGDAWDIDGQAGFNTAMKYVLHAGAGCVIGTATAANQNNQSNTDGCKYGALGAVTGEFVGSLWREHSKEEVEQAQASMQEEVDANINEISTLKRAGATNEEIQDILKHKLDTGGYQKHIDNMRRNGVDLARFSSALVAMLAGASSAGVNVSADTGQNAAENNALFLLAIPFIIKAIDIAFTAYELKNAIVELRNVYRDQGEEAGDLYLAEKIKEWAGNKAFEKILEQLIPGGKIAGMTVDAIKSRISADGAGKGIEKLTKAVRDSDPRDPSTANMLDKELESARKSGELPDDISVPKRNSLDGLPDGVPTPEGFALSDARDIKAHISTAAGENVINNKGIVGRHDADEFLKALYSVPGGRPVRIERDPNNPNIVNVFYEATAKEDGSGRLLEGQYKEYRYPKTIYNPEVYSADDIYNYGLEAAKRGYENAVKNGDSEFVSEFGGIVFRVYRDKLTGEITNFHPKVPDNPVKEALDNTENMLAKDFFK